MTTEPSASAQTPASSAQPICAHPRGWVWFSSADSIARGQISVLAVLEIPLAIALFWCISQVSPWPWFTVLGLMAAPMLLLRSPASIADGVERLRKNLSVNYINLQRHLAKRDDGGREMVECNEAPFELFVANQ